MNDFLIRNAQPDSYHETIQVNFVCTARTTPPTCSKHLRKSFLQSWRRTTAGVFSRLACHWKGKNVMILINASEDPSTCKCLARLPAIFHRNNRELIGRRFLHRPTFSFYYGCGTGRAGGIWKSRIPRTIVFDRPSAIASFFFLNDTSVRHRTDILVTADLLR